MSRENVEVVGRIYDALARGDFDIALSHLHPEIEWHEPPHSPSAGVYRGHEGVRRSFLGWAASWSDYRLDVDDLLEAGDDVLAKCRQRARGRASGVEVEQRLFNVWTLRDGIVVRMRIYHDEAEALEAARLPR